MPSVAYADWCVYCYAKCHYTECRYAECYSTLIYASPRPSAPPPIDTIFENFRAEKAKK